ncbi:MULTISPECIES: branched-chain amino acid ABC transporter permease [Dictyoglomus]|jgi:branched-chain amino acid transport system permease protein|uniref:Inner-membrane translocator n=1 Tax=Dictyoglomus turgidum (strain DSM 6724 / Z-1310) TaxID=515635 RepID=B8E186_DICTD|nr:MULTISPECIES: branched-chain amino acid ABC transporter permease [Dictyoglomus]ACK42214.1 inner-membrane translocator [Dictyoglomus turgidum DSM 6724]PNV79853.1 MAG: branched-chain amino acid ABC transporter permease [Dictyoglomus turgidum]HBU32444.1 branched-chain amino acid ABC transporter permease [Dictyoglomus sp.]
MLENILQQIINGISLGSIYALIALGYTMVYGILRLINFAHGDIYMLGAFIGFFALGSWNMPFAFGLIVAMLLTAVIGILVEKLAYKPLRNAPRISLLITAIGVSFFLENIMVLLVGATPRAFPQKIPTEIYFIGELIITNKQIIILSVSILLMLFLQFIVNKTKIGRAMRAVSQDKEMAQMLGVNIDNVISFTFALGSALAAAGGVLVGMYFNKIEPYMGVMPGLKAFVAAVLGGIGIIPGAMLGGFIMGIAEVLVSGFISSTIRDAVAFVILIIILLIKPTGILGKYMREKV